MGLFLIAFTTPGLGMTHTAGSQLSDVFPVPCALCKDTHQQQLC